MAGVISTGNHPKSLWPGVKFWWGRQYDEHKTEWTDLYDLDTSEKAYEEDVQLTGFGLAPVKREGMGVKYDSETQGFLTRYTHIAYALGYIVTHEELKDNLYEVVSKRRAQANAFSMRQTIENVGASIYNRATDTNYVGGDGVALCVTNHPSQAGTWSNVLSPAADISEAALEDLCIAIYGATNDKGLKINLIPQSLHVHRNDWFEAHRILKSVLQNDTANNAVNVLKFLGVFPKGVMLNHYFTDSDQFFIRTNVPRGMVAYEREIMPLQIDNDFDTMNAKSYSYERRSFGWTDPRAVYCSPGA